MTSAPRRIETERLVIRCYEDSDAPLLKEAVDASLEHLRPWMPWAQHEPQTVEEKVELVRTFRTRFEADEDYVYGIFDRGESRLIGGTGLHRRSGPYALEIGYWIRADALRRGIATEVAAVLTRVAFEQCGAVRVDLKVDPANARSAGIPRKLGFGDEGTAPGSELMLFSVLREEFNASPCLGYGYDLGAP